MKIQERSPSQRKRKTQPLQMHIFFSKKNRNERSSQLIPQVPGRGARIFWARFVPLVPISCPAMWGQIPALCAEKVVAQTSKKRVRAKNLLGNHPGKRAHMRKNTRILSPRMGFEARLISVPRSAQYRQSFCMKTRGKVQLSVHSSVVFTGLFFLFLLRKHFIT